MLPILSLILFYNTYNLNWPVLFSFFFNAIDGLEIAQINCDLFYTRLTSFLIHDVIRSSVCHLYLNQTINHNWNWNEWTNKKNAENPVSIQMRKLFVFSTSVFFVRMWIVLEVNGRSFCKCVLETNFYVEQSTRNRPFFSVWCVFPLAALKKCQLNKTYFDDWESK